MEIFIEANTRQLAIIKNNSPLYFLPQELPTCYNETIWHDHTSDPVVLDDDSIAFIQKEIVIDNEKLYQLNEAVGQDITTKLNRKLVTTERISSLEEIIKNSRLAKQHENIVRMVKAKNFPEAHMRASTLIRQNVPCVKLRRKIYIVPDQPEIEGPIIVQLPIFLRGHKDYDLKSDREKINSLCKKHSDIIALSPDKQYIYNITKQYIFLHHLKENKNLTINLHDLIKDTNFYDKKDYIADVQWSLPLINIMVSNNNKFEIHSYNTALEKIIAVQNLPGLEMYGAVKKVIKFNPYKEEVFIFSITYGVGTLNFIRYNIPQQQVVDEFELLNPNLTITLKSPHFKIMKDTVLIFDKKNGNVKKELQKNSLKYLLFKQNLENATPATLNTLYESNYFKEQLENKDSIFLFLKKIQPILLYRSLLKSKQLIDTSRLEVLLILHSFYDHWLDDVTKNQNFNAEPPIYQESPLYSFLEANYPKYIKYCLSKENMSSIKFVKECTEIYCFKSLMLHFDQSQDLIEQSYFFLDTFLDNFIKTNPLLINIFKDIIQEEKNYLKWYTQTEQGIIKLAELRAHEKKIKDTDEHCMCWLDWNYHWHERGLKIDGMAANDPQAPCASCNLLRQSKIKVAWLKLFYIPSTFVFNKVYFLLNSFFKYCVSF